MRRCCIATTRPSTWRSLFNSRDSVVSSLLPSNAPQRSSMLCRSVLDSCVKPQPSPMQVHNKATPTAVHSVLAPQQLADSDTISHIEALLGPLDTKPLAPPPKPVVIVISGPSGVGKDAVLERLKVVRPDLYFVVTATSRAKRPGEVEGKDYFFVDKAKFEEWRDTNMLLEHAVVYGEYKGIPRQQVDEALAAGTDVVLRIDVQGAATVKKMMPDIISIFITAESEDVLVKRLVARKTEQLDKMVIRVQTARQENYHIPNFDYVVENRDGRLDECVARISSIIDAEKSRVSRITK